MENLFEYIKYKHLDGTAIDDMHTAMGDTYFKPFAEMYSIIHNSKSLKSKFTHRVSSTSGLYKDVFDEIKDSMSLCNLTARSFRKICQPMIDYIERKGYVVKDEIVVTQKSLGPNSLYQFEMCSHSGNLISNCHIGFIDNGTLHCILTVMNYDNDDVQIMKDLFSDSHLHSIVQIQSGIQIYYYYHIVDF